MKAPLPDVEYTFADGSKATVDGRRISGCFNNFATYVHGTKCAAQFSGQTHAPTVRLYRGQRLHRDHQVWQADKEPASPYRAEWNALLDSIRLTNRGPRENEESIPFHREVYEAIAARKPDRAERAMERLLGDTHRRLGGRLFDET